jgi:hypothetical protein
VDRPVPADLLGTLGPPDARNAVSGRMDVKWLPVHIVDYSRQQADRAVAATAWIVTLPRVLPTIVVRPRAEPDVDPSLAALPVLTTGNALFDRDFVVHPVDVQLRVARKVVSLGFLLAGVRVTD